MIATEFFRNCINDNCYNGVSPLDNIDHSIDFYCDTYWKPNKEYLRKTGVLNFVKDAHRTIHQIPLKELTSKFISLDGEFDANKDQLVFEYSGDSFESLKIYTSNIVGSISIEDHQININCRFGNQFLQYMIASASGFIELEKMGSISKDIGLGEWILIYYWKLQLKKAFALGLYKTYESNSEDISTVRGNININRYIRKTFFNGKTFCTFKQHSYDNEINQIIDTTLKKVYCSKYFNIVQDIGEIKRTYSELNLNPFRIHQASHRKVKNPYYKKYNEIYDLSLRILNNKFANVGNDSKFSAFLFDISLLFEHHVRKILKKKFTLNQKNVVEFQVPNGIYENNIFPDIVIHHHNQNKISVFDVKYKHFNNADGVSREDRFQLISYVSCYMNKYEIVECGFIFPCPESDIAKKNIKSQVLKINNREIPFHIRLYKVAENIEVQPLFDKQFLEDFTTVTS